jgi:hypothetical protein
MSFVRRTALFSMVMVPFLAHAQGGMGGMGGMGGGMGGGRRGGMDGGRGGMMERSAPKFPVAKDIEKLNPASLLLDKKKKVALSDSQVTAMKALELKIFERNGALLAKYDSVRKDFKPPTQSSDRNERPDSTQRGAMVQMRTMRDLIIQLADRRRDDVADALALVSEDKRKDAAKLLDDQDKAFGDLIPNMGGAGGEGRGGRGGRGGPPDA